MVNERWDNKRRGVGERLDGKGWWNGKRRGVGW
jgi:hypothetical protein